jgi:sugar/nucleoside kinase (ribokinase family)
MDSVMNEKKKIEQLHHYDVLSIGSVILDIIVEVDDDFLRRLGLRKGLMKPIDQKQSKAILNKLSKYPVSKAPGGSAANTIAGLSLLGLIKQIRY